MSHSCCSSMSSLVVHKNMVLSMLKSVLLMLKMCQIPHWGSKKPLPIPHPFDSSGISFLASLGVSFPEHFPELSCLTLPLQPCTSPRHTRMVSAKSLPDRSGPCLIQICNTWGILPNRLSVNAANSRPCTIIVDTSLLT